MRDDGRDLMAKKRKPSTYDVLMFRVKIRATVHCRFVAEDETPCDWHFVQAAWESDKTARTEARQHVLANPGHEVEVVVRDVARYYLSKELVAELTAVEPSADVVASPGNSQEIQED
jgi:hypothetical protein